MITNKEDLKNYLEIEKKLCTEVGYKGRLHSFITQCEVGKITQFMKILRLDEYYSNTCKKNPFKKLMSIYYRRKHNKLGLMLGISIPINTFERGLLIYHSCGIVVHRDARCGQYCKLHGMNCIGNNGVGSGVDNSPKIGDHLDLGIGAKIIGNVTLADNTTVAAGAVVCKSFDTPYQVLAGIPAKILKIKSVKVI